MKNLKTKLISVITLVSLVGMPVLSLAQSSNAVDMARAAVQKELDELRAAREAFQQAKQDEADQRAAEARTKSDAARKEAEAKRMEAEKRREAQRKDVLLRLIDIQIKHLNNIWRRVQNMPNISDAKKAELKTEIDKAIAGMNDLKAKVQAATTADQLKQLVKQLRDFIKSKSDLIHKIVAAMSADVLKDLSMKADQRIKNAEAKIAELKAAGKDITQLEALLATAKAKLDVAKTAGTREAWSEMRDALKAVYDALKQFNEKAEGNE